MEQQNSFDINGFDDGKGEKLNIRKWQQNNAQDADLSKFSSNGGMKTRNTFLVKIISYFLFFASIALFIAGGFVDYRYSIAGGASFLCCIGGMVIASVMDYRSSKKMYALEEKRLSIKEEGLTKGKAADIEYSAGDCEITKGVNKINNTNVIYNQNNSYNKSGLSV